MALIKCPECGRENVSTLAKACPSCGYPISNTSTTPHTQYSGQQNPQLKDLNANVSGNTVEGNYNRSKKANGNSKAVKIIVSVLIASAVIWACWFFPTRCSWSGCMKHKASSSNYCYYHKYLFNSYTSDYDSYDYSSKSKYDLKITNTKIDTNSAATHCTGTITNNGDETFKFIQLKGSFKDYSGNVIETGDTIAVGSEGLDPGESTSFSISCTRNTSVRSCDVSVYDYD